MGPLTLYDKSFLEGLNLDESVMFDAYFYPVTCPVFYVETLANLAKEKRGRSPEELVGAIASKFPQMHGAPNVHHRTLAVQNLCGGYVSMVGQIALAGGIPVQKDGKNNVIFKESPEAASFGRWQTGRFEDIEREFAQGWRQELANLDLAALAERGRRYGKDLSSCKQIEDCRTTALELIDDLPADLQFSLVCELLRMSASEVAAAKYAWEAKGRLLLREFAPYAHYVLSILVFFDIALATGKISADRPSNFNDMAYLYYLPFCQIFVSSDKLHRVCAPLFMRDGQQFIWGEDLKADLRRHNEMLLGMPEEVRDQGLMKMNPKPIVGSLIEAADLRAIEAGRSKDGPFARERKPVAGGVGDGAFGDELSDAIKQEVRNFHASREYLRDSEGRLKNTLAGVAPPPLSDSERETLQERIQKIVDAADAAEEGVAFDPRDADSVTLQRMVQRKRGSWFQVPKGIRE